MDTKTEEALNKDIKKWKGIAYHHESDYGRLNCNLCHEFHDLRCGGCPVMKRTGQMTCKGSPYVEWLKVAKRDSFGGNTVVSEKAKAAAIAQWIFLKSLLPEKLGRNNG